MEFVRFPVLIEKAFYTPSEMGRTEIALIMLFFQTKCRRKVMYGETKKDLVGIIRKLYEMKQLN